MFISLEPRDSLDMIIACAIAAEALTADCNHPAGDCLECRARLALAATYDRLAVMLDDAADRWQRRQSRRAARTPGEERSPRSTPRSARRQPAGTVTRLPSPNVTSRDVTIT